MTVLNQKKKIKISAATSVTTTLLQLQSNNYGRHKPKTPKRFLNSCILNIKNFSYTNHDYLN